MNKDPSSHRTVAQNRRARFDYFIQQTFEAGIVLTGTEVKSLRAGRASITESYAGEKDGELYLFNAYIPEYPLAGKFFQHETRQPRKLLVHRHERNKLLGSIRRDGITIVPLSIYFNAKGRAKVDIGVAKGKRKADKRQAIKERDWKKTQAKLLKTNSR